VKKKALKTYLVSLTIRHPRKSLNDISKVLGIPFSKNSCNKGDLILGKKRAKSTVWIYDIKNKKITQLNKAVEKLISILSRSSLKVPKAVPSDWEAYLDIAVLYRTYTCSLEIQAKHLKWFSNRNIGLLVSCYPTSP